MSKPNSQSLVLFAVLAMMACVSAGDAQTGTQTTVLTSPPGPQFSVDGSAYYSGSMSAFWPVGSQHTLSIPAGTGYSYSLTNDTQWQFSAWQWSNGSATSPTIQVLGNIGSDRFTAVFNTAYLFTTQLSCIGGPCTSVPGSISVNGSPASSTPTWQAPGSSETMVARSNPGFIFAGWQVNGSPTVTFELTTVPVNGPTVVTAVYTPSKPVTFVTNPPNLQVYADGTLVDTPETLQWALGSSHTIGQLPYQNDSGGRYWVFGSWSDGGAAASHTYVVGKTLAPETVTATYSAAASGYFLTSPINLNLVVDGVVLPPPYQYVWGVGSTHTVTATTPQTDSSGKLWVFQNWDDGTTTPTRSITVPMGADTNGGVRMTAIYTQQAKLTVNSNIAGQVVTVNGSPCTTPCTHSYALGTQVNVAAPATVSMNGGSRQDFVGWATGVGAPVPGNWVSSLNAPTTSITATYRFTNRPTATAGPPRGGTLRLSQGSAAPAISRAGVNNGAGTGAGEGVAQGSVASIYGENLTAESAAAPSTSTAMSLAGLTVHAGTRSLPLYFASPTQVNFQIPPDMPLGPQTLTVSSPNMPDASVDFTVVRTAPGIFPASIDGQTYAMVMHEDGTPVTAAAPARQGELLALYGTGFGPTDHPRPQGAAVPAIPDYRILDRVTIQLGSGVLTPESAIAAPGQIGVDLVQFRLDSSVPSGAAIPLFVTVNGVSSNTLSLPVK